MRQLRSTEKEYLLKVARHAIAKELSIDYELGKAMKIDEKAAVFVTLTIDGELRGCIGTFEASDKADKAVEKFACQAAFKDWRFGPLSKEEFPHIKIEISVLSEMKPTTYDELLAMFDQRPGVCLYKGGILATFLPQVWEDLPEPEEFMAQLCRKAGLSRSAWKKGMGFLTYSVEKFEE
jgi:AmmeMemoRadiSam system protein A